MSFMQRAARIFGLGFIAAGIIGFVSSHSMDTGLLLGLFAVNAVHNAVHLAFGLWGLLAMRTFGAARLYGVLGGVAYLVLAGAGRMAPTGFGIVPIGGYDVWLHLVVGIALLLPGLTARPAATS